MNDYRYYTMGCEAGDAFNAGKHTFEQIERSVQTLPEFQPAKRYWLSETPALDAKGAFWRGFYGRVKKSE